MKRLDAGRKTDCEEFTDGMSFLYALINRTPCPQRIAPDNSFLRSFPLLRRCNEESPPRRRSLRGKDPPFPQAYVQTAILRMHAWRARRRNNRLENCCLFCWRVLQSEGKGRREDRSGVRRRKLGSS